MLRVSLEWNFQSFFSLTLVDAIEIWNVVWIKMVNACRWHATDYEWRVISRLTMDLVRVLKHHLAFPWSQYVQLHHSCYIHKIPFLNLKAFPSRVLATFICIWFLVWMHYVHMKHEIMSCRELRKQDVLFERCDGCLWEQKSLLMFGLFLSSVWF